MIRRPPRSTRTDTLFPHTTLFRSLSQLIEAKDFGELADIRAGARDAAIEGVMLKRRDSPYVPGRRAGLWYKWKRDPLRSEEHTSELQSLMRISYAVFCLKKKKTKQNTPYALTETHHSKTVTR